jgi:hypothetical protein
MYISFQNCKALFETLCTYLLLPLAGLPVNFLNEHCFQYQRKIKRNVNEFDKTPVMSAGKLNWDISHTVVISRGIATSPQKKNIFPQPGVNPVINVTVWILLKYYALIPDRFFSNILHVPIHTCPFSAIVFVNVNCTEMMKLFIMKTNST